MSLKPPTGPAPTSEPIVNTVGPVVVGGVMKPTATNALHSQLAPAKSALVGARVPAGRAKFLRGFRMFAR